MTGPSPTTLDSVIPMDTIQLQTMGLDLKTSQSNRTVLSENKGEFKYSTFNTADILFYTFYYAFLALFSLINLVGNGLIIHCVRRHRHLLVPGTYFILSQACSDLCLGIVYPIYNISHMEVKQIQDTIGKWGSCTVIITATLGMLNVSSYNLVGITISRYISIRDPLLFQHRVTHKRALVAVTLVWLAFMALACGLYIRIDPPANYEWCRYEKVLHSQPAHVIFTCIVSMILPLCIMTVLYVHMAIIARKQAKAILRQARRTSADSLRGSLFRHELKMFRVAGTLLGYFTFAWAPFVIFEFISVVNEQQINRYVRASVRIILHSNSAVNAFIYAGRLTEFRDAMRKEAGCLPCFRSTGSSGNDDHVDMGAIIRARSDFSRTNSNIHGILDNKITPVDVVGKRESSQVTLTNHSANGVIVT